MDADLRQMIIDAGGTVVVRRVTALSPGGAETLGDAVTLPALVEVQRNHMAAGAAGGAGQGTARTTFTKLTIPHEDVVEQGLVVLQEDDRFFVDGDDSSDPLFSRRPDKFHAPRDPDTGDVSHYEVFV